MAVDNIHPLPGAREPSNAGIGKRVQLPKADLYICVSRNLPRRRGKPPTFQVVLALPPELSRPHEVGVPVSCGVDVVLLRAWLWQTYNRQWPSWARGGDMWFDDAVQTLRDHVDVLGRCGLRYSIAIVDLDKVHGEVHS